MQVLRAFVVRHASVICHDHVRVIESEPEQKERKRRNDAVKFDSGGIANSEADHDTQADADNRP